MLTCLIIFMCSWTSGKVKKIPQKPEMQQSRNAKKSEIRRSAGMCSQKSRVEAPETKQAEKGEVGARTRDSAWSKDTSRNQGCYSPERQPLTRGKHSFHSQDSGMCVYMGCNTQWRDKMYKDSPENEFGGLNLHALYGQKKIQSRKSNLSEPGLGVLPGAWQKETQICLKGLYFKSRSQNIPRVKIQQSTSTQSKLAKGPWKLHKPITKKAHTVWLHL